VNRRLIWVLWPGFVMAIPGVGLVFTFLDPIELHPFGHPLEMSRLGAYTVGFLFFWALGAASSALTCYLSRDER
jgi:hypothetical protein